MSNGVLHRDTAAAAGQPNGTPASTAAAMHGQPVSAEATVADLIDKKKHGATYVLRGYPQPRGTCDDNIAFPPFFTMLPSACLYHTSVCTLLIQMHHRRRKKLSF